MRATGLSKRWITMTLRDLVKDGWIEVVRRGGGRGQRTEYRFTPEYHQMALPGLSQKGDLYDRKGDLCDTPSNDLSAAGGVSSPKKRAPIRQGSVSTTKDQNSAARAAPRSDQAERPASDGNYRVALKLAHLVLDDHAGNLNPCDPTLVEALKVRCAQHRIAYNTDLVARALTSACVARKLRIARSA